MKIQILPSLLAADFGNLEAGARVAEAAGADALHLDIMDGHLVPNLSFGPDVVEMARESVKIPLSVHLMLTRPDQYLNRFIDAGADSLLIHVESECDVPDALGRIRDLGVRPGIVLNPETPAEMVFPVMNMVDEILCMSVHPGYGGQAFITSVLDKIESLRARAKACNRDDLDILIDGGIDQRTVVPCAARGANAFIAGTSLYDANDMVNAVETMRRRAAEAFTG
jgi:ribulose-phosphate 3-epimerase